MQPYFRGSYSIWPHIFNILTAPTWIRLADGVWHLAVVVPGHRRDDDDKKKCPQSIVPALAALSYQLQLLENGFMVTDSITGDTFRCRIALASLGADIRCGATR